MQIVSGWFAGISLNSLMVYRDILVMSDIDYPDFWGLFVLWELMGEGVFGWVRNGGGVGIDFVCHIFRFVQVI